MGQGDFGFDSLNSSLNPNINNEFNSSTPQFNGIITPVRVTDILLTEKDFPRFKNGGWNLLGAIKYQLVNLPDSISKNDIDLIALPSSPYVKHYPLINEIVYVISLPNNLIGENNLNSNSYYIDIISLWNHPHHNAFPSTNNNPSLSQQKDYNQTQAGSVSTPIDQPTQVYLGNTFEEKSNIYPLLPFEGDMIYEGRWGNSIRFGSTIMDSSSISINDWSNAKIGQSGDPIIIVRNGQGKTKISEGWIPIIENINTDDSSIYLTSTQQIPIKASSVSYVSYPSNKQPIIPDSYNNDPQIILNSGRLVFNSYNDHILLSSAKSINLNSKESINIDTVETSIQSNKIYLGKYGAEEPLMLGNQTTIFLTQLVGALKEFMIVASSAMTAPSVPGIPVPLPSIQTSAASVLQSLQNLENTLNKKDLTSNRNYTV